MTMVIRQPTARDGAAVHRLIAEVGDLEQNTCYAYLLLCSHFASTSLVAEDGGRLLGCVLGYRPPSSPDAMFVWQVGVHPDARGRGLGTSLLTSFVAQPAFEGARFLEATVGTSNTASRALFERFAARLEVPCSISTGYPAALFGEGASHEDEDLFRIGPIRS